jgi:hypothetical protein
VEHRTLIAAAPTPDAPGWQTATLSPAPSKLLTKGPPALRKGGPVAVGDDASQVPTRAFKPQFEGSSLPVEHDTDTGNGPADPGAPQSLAVTQPGVERASASGAALHGRRRITHESARAVRSRGNRTAGLLVGALLAMALGALGGVLVYRTVSGHRAAAAGLGRLTIATDRPADVRVGDEILHAPFADVYLPAGHHALTVREGTGPWRALQVDVLADRSTRVEVRLDELPAAP